MASAVDPTVPRTGNADTARLRRQFATIKAELEALQDQLVGLEAALAAGIALPADAVRLTQLAQVALSGSYFHLQHRPTIPGSAGDIGAVPLAGGTLTGPLTLHGNATAALMPVTFQQAQGLITALPQVARTGVYSDLTGRPALGTAAALNVEAFAGAAQGAKADTAVQPADLAPVATSGSYGDLVGVPVLGTAASTDATAYATAAQGAKADTAVQPADLAPVAIAGSFGSLTGSVTEGQLEAALAAKVNNTLPYKVDAIRAPNASDDATAGWTVGSLWIDVLGDEAYRCVDASPGAAVWANTTLSTAELAVVALSGQYADLLGKPTVLSAFANDAGFITAGQAPVQSVNAMAGAVVLTATHVGAAPSSHVGAAGAAHAAATQAMAGFMSAADKAKLDGVTDGAEPNAVQSVNGQTGAVVLSHTDVGAAWSGHSHGLATSGFAGFMAPGDKAKLDAVESGATADQTAGEILDAVKSADGAGSGLDADLLDGVQGTDFQQKADTFDGIGIEVPAVGTYDYARSLPAARRIEMIRHVCSAGTATVELRDYGGVLATLSVSTTPAVDAAVSHVVAAGERLYLNVTTVDGCEDLEVWFGG